MTYVHFQVSLQRALNSAGAPGCCWGSMVGVRHIKAQCRIQSRSDSYWIRAHKTSSLKKFHSGPTYHACHSLKYLCSICHPQIINCLRVRKGACSKSDRLFPHVLPVKGYEKGKKHQGRAAITPPHKSTRQQRMFTLQHWQSRWTQLPRSNTISSEKICI